MPKARLVIPVNPYIAGPPLQQLQGFFGREEQLAQVIETLQAAAVSKQIVLFGQRRIGKTSLLYQIYTVLPRQKFLPVFFDLQDRASKPLNEVLAQLVRQIAFAAKWHIENIPVQMGEDLFFENVLPLIKSKLRKRRLVLLLDEFDTLGDSDLPFSGKNAAKHFFPFLRRLLAEFPRMNIICALGRHSEDVNNFEATFKGFLSIPLWVLDEHSARELVLQAQHNGTLNFTEESINSLLQLTGRHPFLTQLVCERLWHQVRRQDINQIPTVTGTEVNKVVSVALEGASQALEWLWAGLSPAERLYVAALAELSNMASEFSHADILKALINHTERGKHPEINSARYFLLNRHIIREVEPDRYKFEIDFFHLWVRNEKTLAIVKDELDKLNAPANKTYEVGKEFFERALLNDAEVKLREAINMNADHLKARLYLGLTLQKKGSLDEAIAELDRAMILDPTQVKPYLRDVLIARAELYTQTNDPNAATAIYRRVLMLDPDNEDAQSQLKKFALRQSDEIYGQKERSRRLATRLTEILQPLLPLVAAGIKEGTGKNSLPEDVIE